MPASRAMCAAPRHVYAGTMSNRTSKPVLCTIHYTTGGNNKAAETISVTLDPGGRAYIPEREFQPTPEATFTCRKVVARIEVKGDERSLVVEQPFEGVTCPVTEWHFDIHNDRIASINPQLQPRPTTSEDVADTITTITI